ncbi:MULTISPECIES: DUF3801 domain-containing protein [Leuconostoc]|uniref:Uncharacterized protein n=1 Tax=Leuconostoc inhae TaxID=178001 RepID=A0AAN2QUX1_9LACO|nr:MULTISPECIES: DUF3801 domain-containing protein [Leuconostoc]MBZ5947829.1 hypothetical protein [Leuconostoc gasicomitatum]MBZ5955683.1 hypothetical protein [Leuconostoc gasicomitatum]MBZ5960699.1 hypothetical protein [Leuconostoc gasicomitatum]MBZ5979921.1 hypothetical protein [Leuconostoc gasicomitatum]MBZ5983297.1 hypothetical protein [Leuconostoc gasicomitatum]
MEQKETVHQMTSMGTMSMKRFIDMMIALQYFIREKVGEKQTKTFSGQQSIYKMMNQSTDPLTSKEIHQEVDLEKLKNYLDEQSLPFSFRKNKDGSQTLFFRVKDQELAAKAMAKVLNQIVNDPHAVKVQIERDKYRKTFDEKVQQAETTTKAISGAVTEKGVSK